jgi:hypothetical protein
MREGGRLSGTEIAELRHVVGRGWSASTSADPENWTEANPAWGQCAVSALLLQDAFGGELLRTDVNGISHYFNRLPSGQCVDLTFDQFPGGSAYGAIVQRERSYVAGFPATVQRYELLKSRVGVALVAYAQRSIAEPPGL